MGDPTISDSAVAKSRVIGVSSTTSAFLTVCTADGVWLFADSSTVYNNVRLSSHMARA